MQVPNESLAMQALEMDISSHIPMPRRKGKGESAGTQSWNMSASLGLSSRKKKDKDKPKGQNRHHDNQGVIPNSCEAPGTDAGPVPNILNGSQFLELPNSIVKVGSSELLGPVGESFHCKEDMDKKQSLAPASTAEKSDLNLEMKMEEKPDSVFMASERQINSPTELTSNKGKKVPNKANSLVSLNPVDGPKKVSSVQSSGREGSLTQRSRRSSVELNRAVSKANITEVFKVREMELTADLSPPNGKKLADLSQDRPKVTNLNTEEEESDSESEVEEGKEDEEEEEEEEEETSIWLNFSALNTLITGPISKILGLVPLFDVVEEEKPSWKSSCKKLISRLYHWALLLLLLFQLVLNLHALSMCHATANTLSEDLYDQCTSVWWPPMALNTGMLIGVILVLMSWGGIFKYQDLKKGTTNKRSQRVFFLFRRISWLCCFLGSVLCHDFILRGGVLGCLRKLVNG